MKTLLLLATTLAIVSAGLTALTAVPDPIATGSTTAWRPTPTDPTGDLAARAIIEKTKNP